MLDTGSSLSFIPLVLLRVEPTLRVPARKGERLVVSRVGVLQSIYVEELVVCRPRKSTDFPLL